MHSSFVIRNSSIREMVSMNDGKLMSMRDAIGAYVPDGASVALGLALEALIPFSAGHEIIRQRKSRLTLIGPISDMLFDQIIGAGCASKVVAAWVGNVSAGLGHNFRRATEHESRALQIEDHSNFSISLALQAGAMGVPFIPTRSLLGTDLLKTNRGLRVITDGGEPLVRVQAVVPDVAIVQVQRSDPAGSAHCWGNLGVAQEGALAASRVIVVTEQIVSPDVIRSDPNRILVPGFKVCAVVHEPGGAHPSPVQGFYARDHSMYHDYHSATRTAEGFDHWAREWVLEISGRDEYLEKLGTARWNGLRPQRTMMAAPVDYGY